MEPGFEAAKGATETILGVKFPVLMRVILPGLEATAVLYPTVAWLLHFLPHDGAEIWQPIAAYVVLVLLLGAMISTMNGEIYKIYEGRMGWPERFAEWTRQRQRARLERLSKAAESAATKVLFDEIWEKLRAYPINDKGDPEVTQPTMLGNILAAYEQYPNNRYGMDSVFYFRRIWLQLDKDQKEEIDNQWCVADGLLLLSAIGLAGATIWTAQALVALLGISRIGLPFGAPGWALAGAAGWLALGVSWYRFSLPFHRENGEVFKSIFDIYRKKVWSLTGFKPSEAETWTAAWSYLQYLAVRCPNCGEWTSIAPDQCSKCNFGLTEFKANLRYSGKLSEP
jgi:hypothetical protein